MSNSSGPDNEDGPQKCVARDTPLALNDLEQCATMYSYHCVTIHDEPPE